MNEETYLYWVRYKATDYYLLWSSGDEDLVVLDNNGAVVSFMTPECAHSNARRLGIELSNEEPDMLDLDAAERWVAGLEPFDPDLLLDVWNLADDVLRTKGQRQLNVTERDSFFYQKLFRSADIPVLEPYRPRGAPVWRQSQLATLRDYISRALAAITSDLKTVAS